MNDMKIEKNNTLIDYSKDEFAKNMKCSKALIDKIDNFTSKLRKKLQRKYEFDEEDLLIGNEEKKYCGRYFGKNNQIWIGTCFDGKKRDGDS